MILTKGKSVSLRQKMNGKKQKDQSRSQHFFPFPCEEIGKNTSHVLSAPINIFQCLLKPIG